MRSNAWTLQKEWKKSGKSQFALWILDFAYLSYSYYYYYLVKNQLQCKYCDQREEVSLREASRQRLTVHKKISDHKIGLFDTPSDETTRFEFNLFFLILFSVERKVKYISLFFINIISLYALVFFIRNETKPNLRVFFFNSKTPLFFK